MSSISSQELADSHSGLKEPECEPSRSVRSIRSVAPSSQSIGQASPATMTLQPSPPLACEQMEFSLASSAEASHVKTSASRGWEQVWQDRAAAYGLNTTDLLANYDPTSSSWRTSQRCLVEDWTRFSGTWPRSGMMRSGTAYQLPPLAPLIKETVSGLLPTPAARDWKGSVQGETLRARATMTRGVSLEEFLLRGTLPTPSAGSSHSAGRLDEWGGKNPFRGTDVGKLHLSPSFVEEIMGFGAGWTELSPSEMPLSRKSRKQLDVQSCASAKNSND